MRLKPDAVDDRASAFSRNLRLESLLNDINSTLWLAECQIILNSRKTEQYPLILIMGPHRSGTTLFMQWLANLGEIAYPSNLLSRFFQAPIIGAKIQLLLTDPRYNFRDELGEFMRQSEYASENGKTKGALAPNEFWYFWRRFFSEAGRDVWTDEELHKTMDVVTMKAEVAGIMDVFQKPFATKGMLFNYNIPFLDSVFEKILFVQIKRDPLANIASILRARKRQFGNEATWYSFDIPEYDQLKELDPISQSAGQVYYINKAVTCGMSEVDSSRKLVVEYEDFCRRPSMIYEALVEKLANFGCVVDATYRGGAKFNVANPVALDDEILKAYKKFEGT